MEEKKTNFFAIPVLSFVPNKYKELVKNSAGKIFGAIFVVFVVLGIIYGVNAMVSLGKFTDEIAANCPEFELSNNEFSIEKPFYFEEDGMYVVIDDSISDVTEDDIKDLIREKFYSQIIVIGRDSLGMFNNGQVQALDYSQLGDFSFSKQSIIDDLIPAFKPLVFAAIVVFYMIAVAFYYLGAWIMSLFTMIICKIFGKDIDSTERFRITVLAKLPIYILTFIVELVSPISVKMLVGVILVIIYTCVIVKLYDEESDTTYIE